jgi:hypothetical protein
MYQVPFNAHFFRLLPLNFAEHDKKVRWISSHHYYSKDRQKVKKIGKKTEVAGRNIAIDVHFIAIRSSQVGDSY